MITRRDFLKRTGATVAGVTIASVAGVNVLPVHAQASKVKLQMKKGKQIPSICPYCAVGCGLLVTESGGKIINIEGNPDSPVNQGSLCPKGAASYQLVDNKERQTKVLYRAPHSTKWEEKPLDWAMEQVAKKIKDTREKTFIEKLDGKTVNMTPAIATLGGSTMENEWNYIHQKLFRALGIVSMENQARI